MLYFIRTIHLWAMLFLALVAFFGQFFTGGRDKEFSFIGRVEAQASASLEGLHSQAENADPRNIIYYINARTAKSQTSVAGMRRDPQSKKLVLLSETKDDSPFTFDGRIFIESDDGKPVEIVDLGETKPHTPFILTNIEGNPISYGHTSHKGVAALYGTKTPNSLEGLALAVENLLLGIPRSLAVAIAVVFDVIGNQDVAENLRDYDYGVSKRSERGNQLDRPAIAMARITGQWSPFVKALEIILPLVLVIYTIKWLQNASQGRRDLSGE